VKASRQYPPYNVQVPHGAACDGFHVAAHAYRRLAQQLQAARCSRLTAVLLGTEHRGTTPIALSRRVSGFIASYWWQVSSTTSNKICVTH